MILYSSFSYNYHLSTLTLPYLFPSRSLYLSLHLAHQLNKFFTYVNMHMVSSTYWNEGIGLRPGDVNSDVEGRNTMVNLGQNMAYLLKKLHPDAPASSGFTATPSKQEEGDEWVDSEEDGDIENAA